MPYSMKKLLRNLTLAALVASPAFYANAELTLTENWYGQSTTIGESWASPDIPGMNARFATGKDGKFYTIDMEQKAIISFEGKAGSTEVSEPTVVKTFTLPEGVKAAGSSLSIDDNGNFIFNFNFVQPNPSPSQAWGMYNPTTDKLYYYTIPADDCLVQRIDHMGRAVGNAASAEGAYGYAFGVTAKYPVVYHFTTKDDVFNVTCEPLTDGIIIENFDMGEDANSGANGWAQPSVSNVTEIAAAPTTSYYATATKTSICTIVDNKVVYPGLPDNEYGIHIGNSKNSGFDTFILNGKRYYVRSFNNNKEWWQPEYASATYCILNFAIFNEEGKIVADWQKSNWKQSTGFASITAEVVNEGTVNIYAYISGTHENIKDAAGKVIGTKTQGSDVCIVLLLTLKLMFLLSPCLRVQVQKLILTSLLQLKISATLTS